MRQRRAKCFLKSATPRCLRREADVSDRRVLACMVSSRLISFRLVRRCP